MLRRFGLVFNRVAVEASLRRARALWSRLQQSDYPNGAIIFCSESIAEVAHPLRPLLRRVYSCGRTFDTSVLRAQLDAEKAPAYGLIVIDGSDACIGAARGIGSGACDVSLLSRVTSTAGASTRRGGQSALRYARLREEADLAFLRRVVERAEQHLQNARGIILAGKADTKNRLLQELTAPLKTRLLCTLDLPCSASLEGLRMAAARAAQAVTNSGMQEIETTITHFMELLQMLEAEGTRACYGRAQTLKALDLGAVDTLLVAEGDEAEWTALAAMHSTNIVKVQAQTAQGVEFCSSFRVGGCLRWLLSHELLDEDFENAQAVLASREEENSTPPDDICAFEKETSLPALTNTSTIKGDRSAPPTSCGEGEVEDAQVPQAFAIDGLCSWLEDKLLGALGNEASAEALCVCVGVVLDCEPSDRSDALVQVREMLLTENVPVDIVEELVLLAQ